MARQTHDHQREKWALIQRTDRANTKLAIFVHGWHGGHLSTWGDLARFLELHADQNRVLGDWDYLFLGYETYSVGNLLNIARIIATQWREASRGNRPFSHRYASLALIGHSLGTLGIRQLLCAVSEQPSGMLRALHCVLFFGSPLNGSPLVSVAGLVRLKDLIKGRWGAALPGAYQINDALRSDGQILQMLQVWNESARHSKIHKLTIKVIIGTDDKVVYRAGLAQWQGDDVRTRAVGHLQMCKVHYKGANTQALILNELEGELR